MSWATDLQRLMGLQKSRQCGLCAEPCALPPVRRHGQEHAGGRLVWALELSKTLRLGLTKSYAELTPSLILGSPESSAHGAEAQPWPSLGRGSRCSVAGAARRSQACNPVAPCAGREGEV